MSLAAPFGSTTPWAEPTWYTGRPSPYYNASHVALRNYLRAWVDANFASSSEEWEAAGAVPPELYQKCAEAGLLVPIASGKSIPRDWARHGAIIAGIQAEDWGGFHDFILWDELTRGGNIANLFIGLVVGAPPLRNFGSEWLKNK